MRKVLITGIRGFTGRYVAAELAGAGYDVWGCGMHPDDHVKYRQLDLTDIAAVRDVVHELMPELVVHLAGIAFVAHGVADAFYQVNLVGTRNLLAALAESPRPVERVLLASSANVYGNATAGSLAEGSPLNPMNDYAVSKLAMEYMARIWVDKLPIVITRPFNYTGRGQSDAFLLPKIVTHFRDRAPFIELGNLDVSRDFSDVRWVARVYRRLLEEAEPGSTFNVCSGRAYSLLEVIQMVSRHARHEIEVRVNPAFVRDHEVKILCGDRTQLDTVAGDVGVINLEETLAWMLQAD